jgi:uncharacterized protein YceK
MKKSLTIFLVAIIAVLMTGCLTVEKKIYKVELKTPSSGTATIKYVNLLSKKDENRDVSLKDFAELITDYFEGPKYEQDYPGARNIKKRLFEENGVLCSEVIFEFDSLETIKLFKLDKDSPYMFYTGSTGCQEEITESNGTQGNQQMPVHFWKKDAKILEWTAVVLKELTDCVSLIEQYRSWEKMKKQ